MGSRKPRWVGSMSRTSSVRVCVVLIPPSPMTVVLVWPDTNSRGLICSGIWASWLEVKNERMGLSNRSGEMTSRTRLPFLSMLLDSFALMSRCARCSRSSMKSSVERASLKNRCSRLSSSSSPREMRASFAAEASSALELTWSNFLPRVSTVLSGRSLVSARVLAMCSSAASMLSACFPVDAL